MTDYPLSSGLVKCPCCDLTRNPRKPMSRCVFCEQWVCEVCREKVSEEADPRDGRVRVCYRCKRCSA